MGSLEWQLISFKRLGLSLFHKKRLGSLKKFEVLDSYSYIFQHFNKVYFN